jgi:glycosyltransferase involved in cell wall biosynthesis
MNGKILYIYPERSAFIEKDLKFLSRSYTVVTPGHDWKSKVMTPLNFLKQLVFLIRNMRGTKAVFIMFGGYWSLLPALAGKITRTPVYIIPGGTDCVSFPSLSYGSLRKPVMRTFIRWSFQLCTELLPVDESLILADYTYLPEPDYPKQGIRYFFPGLKTPWRVIHNGFDPEFFSADPALSRDNSFIAVAPVSNMMRVRVKGVDLIIDLAKRFGNCSFTVVGVAEAVAEQLSPLPPNLKLYPFLPGEKFRGLLAESRFVLQLSVSEGFPNALCEAMLCHCVPLGSAVGAIPEIIGDTGFIAASRDKDYLFRKIEEALGTSPEKLRQMALRARNRIAESYHISKREKAFLGLISER